MATLTTALEIEGTAVLTMAIHIRITETRTALSETIFAATRLPATMAVAFATRRVGTIQFLPKAIRCVATAAVETWAAPDPQRVKRRSEQAHSEQHFSGCNHCTCWGVRSVDGMAAESGAGCEFNRVPIL